MRLYLGLYGKLIKKPVIYCRKHSVYLEGKDVSKRQCNFKNCHYKLNKEKWRE